MKDYIRWFKIKKKVNNSSTRRFYRVRDIWWVTLGENIGFEQDGAGSNYQRPALILKGFSREVCLVVPLTTSKKDNRYMVPIGIIDGRGAQVIVSQIRLIDTQRLVNRICVLDETIFNRITNRIKAML